jgi:hypothetical protein
MNQAALKQTELITFSSNSLWTDIIASANLNPRSSAGNWSCRLCPSRNIRCTSNTRAEPMGLRLLRKAGDTWARPIAKRPSKSVPWNLSGSNSPKPLLTTLCTNLQTEQKIVLKMILQQLNHTHLVSYKCPWHCTMGIHTHYSIQCEVTYHKTVTTFKREPVLSELCETSRQSPYNSFNRPSSWRV